jgi:nucleoid DNA-binding protein
LITEDQIVREIAKQAHTKTSLQDINIIVTDCFNIVSEHLKKGQSVNISELGTFTPTKNIKKSFVEISKMQNLK